MIAPSLQSPFKFLDAYTAQDKDRFFGRETEQQRLIELIFRSRLTLIYGESGTGKTSLVQCGLGKVMDSSDYFPVMVRRRTNLITSLKTTLGNLLDQSDHDDVVAMVTQLSRYTLRPVYLIFDQFEELFISGDRAEQEEFFTLLNALYQPANMCKLLVVIREDYISKLYPYEDILPQLLDFRLRVEPMSEKKLQEVIIGTCHQAGIELGNEQQEAQTVQLIIDNNKGSKNSFQLPYLQVYLDRLWRTVLAQEPHHQAGPVRFDPALVKKVAKIDDVLAQFIEDQKQSIGKNLSTSDYTAITTILEALVTYEGTRKQYSIEKLATETGLELTLTGQIIRALEAARILQYNAGTYELAHDSLAKVIDNGRSKEQRQVNAILIRLKADYDEYVKNKKADDLLIPKRRLSEIQLYESAIQAEMDRSKPDGKAIWQYVNDSRLFLEEKEAKTDKELKRTRRVNTLLSYLFLLAACLGIIAAYQTIIAQEQERESARTEGNRLLQLLDNSEEQNGADSVTYSLSNNPVYNNPSLKYQIALEAHSILPNDDKSRAIKWLDRLSPMPGKSDPPFYNLSIDAHGSIRLAGFQSDGSIVAIASDSSKAPQVWTITRYANKAWQANPDSSGKQRTLTTLPKVKYGSSDAKALLRKKLIGEDTSLTVSEDGLLRVGPRNDGTVRIYKGPTNTAEEFLLAGHQTPVNFASLWKDTTEANKSTLLLTADSTGIIRVYDMDHPCLTPACLAKLLPAEKFELAMDLSDTDLQQLALSRDWSKLSQYFFKLENYYHQADLQQPIYIRYWSRLGTWLSQDVLKRENDSQKFHRTRHPNLDRIVDQLTQPKLLAKQSSETLYRFWLKVALIAQTKENTSNPSVYGRMVARSAQEDTSSRPLYVRMANSLSQFMHKWSPESPEGRELARSIVASENRLDFHYSIQFLNSWSPKPASSIRITALKERIYKRSIQLNSLEADDKQAYLGFVLKQGYLPDSILVKVIYNLSKLNSQSKSDETFQQNLTTLINRVKGKIRSLPDESFNKTSPIEVALSIMDDTLWCNFRVAEYNRRIKAGSSNSSFYRLQLVEAYGNLAYYQTLARDYKGAIKSAWRGIILGRCIEGTLSSAWCSINQPVTTVKKAEYDWIRTNLASAYLLNGQFTDAKTIYSRYKNKSFRLEGDTYLFRRAFLEDLGATDQKKLFESAVYHSTGTDQKKLSEAEQTKVFAKKREQLSRLKQQVKEIRKLLEVP